MFVSSHWWSVVLELELSKIKYYVFLYLCLVGLLVATIFEPFLNESIKGGTIGNKVWAQLLYMVCTIAFFCIGDTMFLLYGEMVGIL